MSDSNRVEYSAIREVDLGTTPNSALQEYKTTGGAMPHGQDTVRSATLRSDAQQADSKRVGITPSANQPFELAAGMYYDEFMRGSIRSDNDWTTEAAVAGTLNISANASGNTYTSGAVDLTDGGLITKGVWIYVAGFVTAGNNGWKKVTSAASGTLVVAQTLTDEGNKSATMKVAWMTNGVEKASYSLQEYYLDLTNKGRSEVGARINTFSLSQTPSGIITGAIAFDGIQRAAITSRIGDGSVTAAPAKDVRTEVDGFETVWIDNVALTTDVMGLDLNIATPTRRGKPLGSLPSTRIGLGAVDVTGSISMYLEDNTWTYDGSYEGFTPFSLAFSLDMGGGDRYIIELPQAHFSNEPASNPGQDSDIMLDFDFDAESGGSFGLGNLERTIFIGRVRA